MVTDQDLSALVASIAQQALQRAVRIVTAESCTGGWIAKLFTDLPGSSRWFECGFVTYSDAAKMRDLGVSPQTLRDHGAVSEMTVREMATGALRAAGADVSVAVSGIAGPDGGSAEKPVGTVWLCSACRGRAAALTAGGGSGELILTAKGQLFGGDREAIRRASVEHALKLLARVDALR